MVLMSHPTPNYLTIPILTVSLMGCGGGSGDDPQTSNAAIQCGVETASFSVSVTRVFPLLSFRQPVALLQSPDKASWYVVEKAGRILVVDDANPTAATEFADLQDRVDDRGEGGLLGMAFDPNFNANQQVYLSYTSSTILAKENDTEFHSVISRVRVDTSGQHLDIDNEAPLLTLAQRYTNHNGGHIVFGPDNFLYMGFGDGGSSGDPSNNGQDTANLHGAILRLDVSGSDTVRGTPYRIPAGNPFSANPDCTSGRCPEIFSWGFRNPWRWSFDSDNGDLWIADVGQHGWEEINRVKIGRNYGWRCFEGSHAFNQANCTGTTYQNPVAEYSHAVGQSITGGFVYHGNAIPELSGAYVFGDFVNGRIWAFFDANGPAPRCMMLADTDLMISSFGQQVNGAIYVVDFLSGGIFRIDPI